MLNATWQRCRVHFMRNVLAHAGKSGRRVVSAFIATAFAQDDAEAMLSTGTEVSAIVGFQNSLSLAGWRLR